MGFMGNPSGGRNARGLVSKYLISNLLRMDFCFQSEVGNLKFQFTMLDSISVFLEHSAVARIFLIVALGYLLGEVKFPGNFRFGVAAVLFVGLAMGAWRPSFTLPEEIQTMGLVLFVYCVGLQAAPGFFQCLKKDGLKMNLALLAVLLLAFAATWLCTRWSGQPKEVMTGLFCGALTNTPALGAATEWITRNGAGAGAAGSAVVGYGVTYPFAVLAVLLLFQLRLSRAPATETAAAPLNLLPRPQTIEVQTHDPHGESWRAAAVMDRTGLVLTRCRLPSGKTRLVDDDTPLPPGTLVVAVGPARQLEAGVKLLGRVGPEPLEANLAGFEVHRYFVSNHRIAGRALGELGADLEKLGAVVSRVRRGDVDLTADDDTVLHFGDRVKVVSYRQTEAAVRKFFGNSLQGLSETGYFSFAIGILLGLALGKIPFPVPGLQEPIRLGAAGGPLIMALILGSRGRTGPFIWQLPFSTNLTLRHLGILFFLAAAGVKAGAGLLQTLKTNGVFLIGFGVGLTAVCHLVFWWLLARQNQRQVSQIFGASSALQTQPAALSFAAARVPHGPLNLAYATVYPLSMILKVVLAQLLLITS